MKTNYLLPNKYKKIGWFLFIIGITLGILLMLNIVVDDSIHSKALSIFDKGFSGESKPFAIIETGILNEIIIISIIIGGLLIGLAKEKNEDEFISKLRSDSFVWAIIVNYIILLVASLVIFDLTFFSVLIFNMFTPIIFFIIRFNFLKFKSNSDEE